MEQVSIHYYKTVWHNGALLRTTNCGGSEHPGFPEASSMAHGNILARYLIADIGVAVALRSISTKSLPASTLCLWIWLETDSQLIHPIFFSTASTTSLSAYSQRVSAETDTFHRVPYRFSA